VIAENFKKVLEGAAAHSNPDDDVIKRFTARQASQRDLPSFSGKPEEWPFFISQFQNSTNLCEYTQEENFLRLQKALTGKAKESVLALLTLLSNVNRVVKTLAMRNGRADQVINTLIVRARSIPLQSDKSMDSLIEFGTTVEKLVGTMESMNYLGHMSNPQLMEDLVMKLPYSLRVQWGTRLRQILPTSPNLKDLSTWLIGQSETACLVAHTTTQLPPNPMIPANNQNFRPPPIRRHMYVTKYGKKIQSTALFVIVVIAWKFADGLDG